MKSKSIRRLLSFVCALLVTAGAVGIDHILSVKAEAVDNFSISVDGKNITDDSLRLGMVSANGSSRLLIDYKAQSPKAYWELIDHLFSKETGIGLTHIKLEMGSDVDSSSGSEPATKRLADEKADVTRGAGFQLAADIKSVYPNVSVDLLQWGEPAWAHESYSERYRWYKETLDAAYDTYGLKFDYVGINPNESGVKTTGYNENVSWMKYFSCALKAEVDGRYDYSQIKTVAADEVVYCSLADAMLEDDELRDAVDVIGIHYSTWSNDSAKKLKEEYGKEIWYSEGTAVTVDPALGKNATTISGLDSTLGEDGGLTGTNGTLEIGARILNMYPQGSMTMYEFQPAVASYYLGSVYTPKQLITANTPWSGYYKVESGAAMASHFTRFLTDDMRYVDGACYGDGEKNTATGDGHGLVNTTNNYITLADKKTGDYTMIFVNDSHMSRSYSISVANLKKSGTKLNIWKTSGSDQSSWLTNIGSITPKSGKFSITVEPYSIITLTTLDGQKSFAECQTSDYQIESADTVLPLPYYDNYNYEEKFIASRGGAPLYQTDVSGSFEVQDGVLVQKVKYNERPYGWGNTENRYNSDPYTQVGDDRWSDYKASIDVTFDKTAAADAQNYTALGVRYTSSGSRGYFIKLYANGKWQAVKGGTLLKEGGIKSFDMLKTHKLKVKAVGNKINYYIDNALVYSHSDSEATYTSGRVSIFSGLANNTFDNLSVEPVNGGSNYVSKTDALSDSVSYSGKWELKAGDSYNYNNRTKAVSSTSGAFFNTSFSGTGVNLVSGSSKECTVKIEIDGKTVEASKNLSACGSRQTSYSVSGLDDKVHSIKVTVLSGEFTLDTIESVCALSKDGYINSK